MITRALAVQDQFFVAFLMEMGAACLGQRRFPERGCKIKGAYKFEMFENLKGGFVSIKKGDGIFWEKLKEFAGRNSGLNRIVMSK